MCIQKLIWCACGHGEFLPIEKCARATRLGYCWTVIWGDHEVAIALPCSYCKAGLNRRRPLGSAKPKAAGTLAAAASVNGMAEGVAALGLVDDQGLPLPLDLPFRPVRHMTNTTTAAAGQADSTTPQQPVLEPVYQLPVPDENFCMLDADQTFQGLDNKPAEAFPLDPLLLPPTPPPEWEDVLGTDFTEGFDLNQELWQYS
ncbi:hypothetical protein LTR48_002756 [Friedmanniomyces endolithicus]|uniref:Uncharacterized protein n=2 Tax=Dothideomycetidae TaxID=451867 RepID=A0A4U0V2P7_9PEZI|nr:hypothetical protein LTS09_000135 [Friedmanniomyces endolithicus]KAK5145752.1 hypothetical protein LTR32_002558 [Rachicladosporium monterosium]KAK0947376.1 hypothetical protein LTR29_001332 [Friedmanniomyces endolithicus]KAK1093230.1 hypothetical protein LTR48_002756 [Friedmanniomyces endolithicus]KAK1822682.1 hypothetical protein LTR12_002821 [Friedmanniomyces endolithicus]